MEKVLAFIKKHKLWFILASVFLCTLAIDLITKSYFEMRDVKGNNESIVIIKGLLEFKFTKNYGASLGLFSGESTLFIIITLIGIPFFCGFLYYNRKKHIFGNIGLALVISGAVGNAIDRLINASDGFFTGYVRDFVDMRFFICNVADMCMSIGVAMLLIAILFLDNPKKAEKNVPAPEQADKSEE